METFGDVIGLWPSLSDLAADAGVSYGVAKQWRLRDSIPAAYWSDVINGAARRGMVGITADKLTEIASKRADAATEQDLPASPRSAESAAAPSRSPITTTQQRT